MKYMKADSFARRHLGPGPSEVEDMLHINRLAEICRASSPEKEIPKEIRRDDRSGGLEERVMSNPIPYALLLSIRRGGTFKDVA